MGCYSEGSLDETSASSVSFSTTDDPTPGTSLVLDTGAEHGDSTSLDASTGGVDTGDTDSGETDIAITDASGDSTTTAFDDSSDGGSSVGDESSTGEPVLGVDELLPGDLVITEVMWNPNCSGDSCEWVEILNATTSTVNLLDLYVRDDEKSIANQGRLTDDILVAPGGLVVITRGVGDWPYSFDAAGVYGPNPGLNNGEPDFVSIHNDAEMLDDVPWLPFDEDEGIAWSLSGDTLDAVSNDNSLNWCLATDVLMADAATEFGTPLVTNPSCGG
ncbi:MAG: lamin tail domain-containing protein [Deltaproteobacteria bacterium]|nr:lamin tail domain-containing protein [Nannocystaceae bacterium]